MDPTSNNDVTSNMSIPTTTGSLENNMASTASVTIPAISTGSLGRPYPMSTFEELRALRLADIEATNNRIENMSSALMRRMENFQQHIESSVAWMHNEILSLSCAMQNRTNPMENQPAGIAEDSNVGRSNRGGEYNQQLRRDAMNNYTEHLPPQDRDIEAGPYPIRNAAPGPEMQALANSSPCDNYDIRQRLTNRAGNLYEQSRAADTKLWGAPKLTSPTFRGATPDRPIRYLHEINQYREALGPRYNFRIIIEQSLTGLAKEWWTIVEQSIETWEDFTVQFRRRFWIDFE